MGVEGANQFRAAALAMTSADQLVLKEVAKGFRAVAKPVTAAIRKEVRAKRGTSPKGTSSSVERQLHVLSKVKAKGVGSFYIPETGQRNERRIRSVQRRVIRFSSLRNLIASASGAAVSANPKNVGLTFRVRAGLLPPSQRKLPRRWDLPDGWKHPVFGNRKIWVRQIGNPYFRSTINSRREDIDAGVIDAFEHAGDRVMHPEEGGESE